MVIKVSDENGLLRLKNAYYSVFKSNDPFAEMFQDLVKNRIILCPLEGFYLDQEQYIALVKAIAASQDDKVNISEIESGINCFNPFLFDDRYQCQHWELTNNTPYNGYRTLPIILENAIYSPSGKWGVIISHEGHAVIGGTDEFIDAFKTFYPYWEDGMQRFIELWNYNMIHYESNVDWVSILLSYVNSN